MNLARLFRDKEYRRSYVEAFSNTSIAAQIKANREKRQLSQAQLADLAGMKQSRISTVENVNYESWNIRTLRRLADAFDLVLVVRFESFGKVLDDIAEFTRDTIEQPSFDEDPAFKGDAAGSAGTSGNWQSLPESGKVLGFPTRGRSRLQIAGGAVTTMIDREVKRG